MQPGENTVDQVLTLVQSMPLDQQEWLVDLLSKRYHEQRRAELAANARETRAEYEQGLVRIGTVDDLLADLDDESDLGQ